MVQARGDSILRPFAALAAAAMLAAAAAPSAAQAPEESRVTLNTEDGWALSARWLPPAGDAPVVVMVHTQKSDLTEWEPWMKQMKRYGFGYLAFDLRGHGNSFVMPDGSTTTWRAFSVSGSDNEYNKMLRDVDAALAFLSTNSIAGERTVIAGSVLGANLAIKAAAIHTGVAMVIAISPALNVNDVLTVNPLRVYGRRPLLMIGGADKAKQYKELQLLNDIARMSCGKENVTVIVEARGIGPDLVTKYNARRVMDWIKHPRLPKVVDRGAPPEAAEPGADEQEAGPAEDQGSMPDYSQE